MAEIYHDSERSTRKAKPIKAFKILKNGVKESQRTEALKNIPVQNRVYIKRYGRTMRRRASEEFFKKVSDYKTWESKRKKGAPDVSYLMITGNENRMDPIGS